MNKQKLMSAVLVISICFTSFAGCGKTNGRGHLNVTYNTIISDPVPFDFDWQYDKAKEMDFFSKGKHFGKKLLAFTVLHPDKAALYSLMATTTIFFTITAILPHAFATLKFSWWTLKKVISKITCGKLSSPEAWENSCFYSKSTPPEKAVKATIPDKVAIQNDSLEKSVQEIAANTKAMADKLANVKTVIVDGH
jgi:hypothetical protein